MKGKEKPFAFRGKFFIALAFVVYVVVFFFDQQLGLLALQKSGRILLKILPVFAVVILFTAFLNYVLKPKQLVKHLGEESGVKGLCIALISGVLSHGPMYAWYPLIEDLRGHGVKDSLIVVFFYARAIKLPFLPLMIDYFGLIFTLSLSFFILTGALLQGWIVGQLERM
ncbi:MAG: permease [Desulfobulbaceae bacterium]|nr:permease [Desulfobulbaceae bacterium]